jgi:hypothetical protein
VSSYKNTTNDITRQGVLQGSSSASPIYILNSNVSLSVHRKTGVGASFQHPITGKTTTDLAVQFVDDTLQFGNMSGASLSMDKSQISEDSLIQAASRNAQTWANYLWISGNSLNLSKCFHYAFLPYYNFKKHAIAYKNLFTNTKYVVVNLTDKKPTYIDSLLPNEARQTLGFIIVPDGQPYSTYGHLATTSYCTHS